MRAIWWAGGLAVAALVVCLYAASDAPEGKSRDDAALTPTGSKRAQGRVFVPGAPPGLTIEDRDLWLQMIAEDDDPARRAGAVLALSQFGAGGPEDIRALSVALKDNDETVRVMAAMAFAMARDDISGSGDLLAQALADEQSPEVKRWLLDAVLVAGEAAAAALPALRAEMASPDAELALWARAATAKMSAEPQGHVNELIRVLRVGDSAEERGLAAYLLGRLGGLAEQAVPDLVVALNDTDAKVQSAAVESLAWIGQRPELVVPALLEVAEDPQRQGETPVDPRIFAIKALQSFQGRRDEIEPVLLRLAGGGERMPRRAAIFALAQLDEPSRAYVSILADALATGEEVDAALGALEDMARPPVELIGAVASVKGDRSLRAEAARILGRPVWPAEQAVPLLLGMLSDDSEVVVVFAIDALSRRGAGGAEVAEALTAKLIDGPYNATNAAIDALQRMGPEARVALPALKILGAGGGMADADPSLSAPARQAVARIEALRPAEQATTGSAQGEADARLP